MARTARKKAASEIYHLVFKGVNHERIFEEESQKRKMNLIMYEKLKDYEIEIYAYCIMPTHVHLLARGDLTEISAYIKRCEIVYAMQYNLNQLRNGHLFQNRFFSEGVEDERYFWNCINYIHNNPVKAEIVKTPSEYTYSSYLDYEKERKLNLIHPKAKKLIKKKFYRWEDFEKFSFKDEQFSWFIGTEEEVKAQKSALVLQELRKMKDLAPFENAKKQVRRTEKVRELSRQLNMKQIEVMDEINRYKSEIEETD